jgi:uncharacterized protein (TIGR02757 family)
MHHLKNILDRFYREYDFTGRVRYDPVEFPHRYKNPADIEVSGFIASCLAYGRVDLFKSVIEKILSMMGASPYDFLMNFNPKRHAKLFNGIKYRFNENEDIICMLLMLRKVLNKFLSVENAFKRFYRTDDRNIEKGLTGLMNMFSKINTSPVYGKDIKPRGLIQFFPSPEQRSACKRANLFLRWMIRDEDIDFGVWTGIPKNKLIIPLDTHIARISRCLGFTKRVSQDWKMAVEITEALKKLDARDPLKYDFALCHHGISGLCRDNSSNENCQECDFKVFSRV